MAQTLISDNHLFGNSAGAMLSGVGSGVTASLAVSTNGLAVTFNPNTTVTLASGLIFGQSNVTGGGIAFGPDITVSRSAASVLTLAGGGSTPTLTSPGGQGIVLACNNNSTNGGQLTLNSAGNAALSAQTSVLLAPGNVTALTANANSTVTLASGLILGTSNVTGGGISWPDAWVYRSAANALTIKASSSITVDGGVLLPSTAGGQDLGSSSFQWRDLQLSRLIQGGSTFGINVNGVANVISINGTAQTSFASGIILGTSDVTGGGIALGNIHLYRASATQAVIDQQLYTSSSFLSQNGFTSNTAGSPSTPSLKVNTANSAGLYIPGSYALGFVASGTDVGWLGFPTSLDLSLLAMSGAVSARSYRAAVSGAAIPLIGASATGTYNIDFTNSSALQTITITGATLFSGVNYVQGGATTVRINVSGNNAAAVRFPALWNNGWVTDVPTGLATGRFALLTINTFAAADSGAMVAWAVAP